MHQMLCTHNVDHHNLCIIKFTPCIWVTFHHYIYLYTVYYIVVVFYPAASIAMLLNVSIVEMFACKYTWFGVRGVCTCIWH